MKIELLSSGLAAARGLLPADAQDVRDLIELWARKKPRNDLRDAYYLSHVALKDLGVSIPKELAGRIDPRIDWPKKAVLALADRSQFDGFAASDPDVEDALGRIVAANQIKALYRRNLIGELKHCCGFWTVTAGDGGPVVSAYPASAACALWDDSLKAIRCGLVVVESKGQAGSERRAPSVVEVYNRDAVIVLRRDGEVWSAEYRRHSMGRPLMEPMPFEPTLERPFGHSRITRTVMSITDDAVREKARSEIAAEFAAFPQKWLLGTDAETVDDSNRYSVAMGVIQEVGIGPDADRVPTIWQSPQLSMQPHIDYMRALACQFSGATNVPLSALGVVSDNPSSAEAIYAAKEDLVIDAQNLNAQNGIALRNVALMALAVSRGTDFAAQRDSGVTVNPRFRNPAMPSVVSQTAAIVQQVSAIPWLADTEVALEELGYSEEQIARLQEEKRANQGRELVDRMASAAQRQGGPQRPGEVTADDAEQAGA